MSKELAKTYDPKGLEDRLYQKWLDKKYFHAEVNPEQEAVYHRDAAAKRYRTAAYGPCAGQDDAGYPDPLQDECRAMKRCGSRAQTMRRSQRR